MPIKIQAFDPTAKEKQWIANERRTAWAIRTLWAHASRNQRKDADFLRLLVQFAWVNNGPEEVQRRWRNGRIATWLGLAKDSVDSLLEAALARQMSMTSATARSLIRTNTGITAYYRAHRPTFLVQVGKHTGQISQAFSAVAQKRKDTQDKVRRVAARILALPEFKTPNGGSTSMMNGLAPALACLDPQKRFPIVNARTERLLNALGRVADVAGVISLSRLIGKHKISDSFALDVYATSRAKDFVPAKRGTKFPAKAGKAVGLKSEEESFANLAKRRIAIRKRHNALINRFRAAIEWSYPPTESEYDVLIRDWQPGRRLLVEAKTEWKGGPGRTQLRQAIGQLFDYRWRSFRATMSSVDLAVLTPGRPEADVIELLRTLGIHALWFEGKRLSGTVSLVNQGVK